MKTFIRILAFLPLFFACYENRDMENLENEATKRNMFAVDGSYTFEAVKDPAVWRTFQTLEEMQEACQIPEEILKKMSTEDLVTTCMNYPLYGNYLAYNNELKGIKTVMAGFNGFEELKKRTDTAEKLLAYYENIDVKEIIVNTRNTTINEVNKNAVTILKLDYIELLLATDAIVSRMKGNEIERLQRITKEKYEQKLLYPNNYGALSLKSSHILTREVNDEANLYNTTNFTIYTKCGKAVEALIPTEMSASEIEEINAYYIKTYPNATFLSSATSSYNCHSYAWNMNDGGSSCWINSTISTTNDNLNKYFDRDYYSATTSAKAEKIFYYNSDHSAIKSSISGMYESKWGAAPLMRHAPNYGPYNDMNNMQYYNHAMTNGSLIASYGDGEITVGTSVTYTLSIPLSQLPYGNYVQNIWSITDANFEEVDSNRVDCIEYDNYIVVTFKSPGLYNINFEVKLTNGETLALFSFQPIVTL